MKATKILCVIAVLQALMLVSIWKGDAFTSTAKAGSVPEPGADRKEMISELKSVNEKLAGIEKILDSGKMQVEVVSTEKK